MHKISTEHPTDHCLCWKECCCSTPCLHRPIWTPGRTDHIGLTHRWSYPTFLVETDNGVYSIPLHKAPKEDHIAVDLIRRAFENHHLIELEVRRSAFWGMDGSIDDVSAIITGVRIG